jgi:hypothetical protein
MDEQEARISWWASVRGTNLTNWFFEVRGGSRVCFTCSRRMRFPYPYILFVLAAEASAAIVELDYVIIPGYSTGNTITIPNPDGLDFVVTPSAEISGGVMTVRFFANTSGVIENGSTVVTALEFTGSTNLRATTGEQLFGQDIFVDITGPLSANQETWSFGSLEGLSTYSEATNGTYDTLFGPTGCSGNLFNAGCLVIQTLAGVTFPLDGVSGDDVSLAILSGTFGDLNSPGNSTAESSFEFPLEAAGGIGAPLPVLFSWVEMDRRLVVPEPHSVVMALLGVVVMAFRKRR